MKTKILITALNMIFAVFVFGQDKQPTKSEIKAEKVEKSIKSGRYEITVNQVNPMTGRVRHLTSDYSVRISGDSCYVYLPYFGRAYSLPYGGDGGIKVTNVMENYKMNKEGKSYTISFSAKGNDDTFRFSVSVWINGSTEINVTSNNRQTISYSGYLTLPDE